MHTISIVTPTFNSMRTFSLYMDAIIAQDYPHELLEIIFADGGSTDGTLDTIEKYKLKCDIKIIIFHNQLRTAEAGKALGVKKVKNEIVCLLDSDNIIPDTGWLALMMKPFDEEQIVASEPIEYTYRREDSVINRYCSLVGVNDPLCIFTGNYDRYCHITNKWTQMPHDEQVGGGYIIVSALKPINFPPSEQMVFLCVSMKCLTVLKAIICLILIFCTNYYQKGRTFGLQK